MNWIAHDYAATYTGMNDPMEGVGPHSSHEQRDQNHGESFVDAASCARMTG
jgi:hypothetical protein